MFKFTHVVFFIHALHTITCTAMDGMILTSFEKQIQQFADECTTRVLNPLNKIESDSTVLGWLQSVDGRNPDELVARVKGEKSSQLQAADDINKTKTALSAWDATVTNQLQLGDKLERKIRMQMQKEITATEKSLAEAKTQMDTARNDVNYERKIESGNKRVEQLQKEANNAREGAKKAYNEYDKIKEECQKPEQLCEQCVLNFGEKWIEYNRQTSYANLIEKDVSRTRAEIAGYHRILDTFKKPIHVAERKLTDIYGSRIQLTIGELRRYIDTIITRRRRMRYVFLPVFDFATRVGLNVTIEDMPPEQCF